MSTIAGLLSFLPPPTNVAFKRSQEYSRSGVLTSTLDRQQAAGSSSGGLAAAGAGWRQRARCGESKIARAMTGRAETRARAEQSVPAIRP